MSTQLRVYKRKLNDSLNTVLLASLEPPNKREGKSKEESAPLTPSPKRRKTKASLPQEPPKWSLPKEPSIEDSLSEFLTHYIPEDIADRTMTKKVKEFGQKIQAYNWNAEERTKKYDDVIKTRFTDLVQLVMKRYVASVLLKKADPRPTYAELFDSSSYFNLLYSLGFKEENRDAQKEYEFLERARTYLDFEETFSNYELRREEVIVRLYALYQDFVNCAQIVEKHLVVWNMITGDPLVDEIRCNSPSSLLKKAEISLIDPTYERQRLEIKRFFDSLDELKTEQNTRTVQFFRSRTELKTAVYKEMGMNLSENIQHGLVRETKTIVTALLNALSGSATWAFDYGNFIGLELNDETRLYQPYLVDSGLDSNRKKSIAFYENLTTTNPTEMLNDGRRKYLFLNEKAARFLDGVLNRPSLGNKADPRRRYWSHSKQRFLDDGNRTVEKHLLCLETEVSLMQLNLDFCLNQLIERLKNAGISVSAIYEEDSKFDLRTKGISNETFLSKSDREEMNWTKDENVDEVIDLREKRLPFTQIRCYGYVLSQISDESDEFEEDEEQIDSKYSNVGARNASTASVVLNTFSSFGLGSLEFLTDKASAAGTALCEAAKSILKVPLPAKGEGDYEKRLKSALEIQEKEDKAFEVRPEPTTAEISNAIARICNLAKQCTPRTKRILIRQLNALFLKNQNQFLAYSLPNFDPESIEYVSVSGNSLKLMHLEEESKFLLIGRELDFEMEDLLTGGDLAAYFKRMWPNMTAKVYGDKRVRALDKCLFERSPKDVFDFSHPDRLYGWPESKEGNPFSCFYATESNVEFMERQSQKSLSENAADVENITRNACAKAAEILLQYSKVIKKELYYRIESMRRDMMEMPDENSDDYCLGELNIAKVRTCFAFCYCGCLSFVRYFSDPDVVAGFVENGIESNAFDSFVKTELELLKIDGSAYFNIGAHEGETGSWIGRKTNAMMTNFRKHKNAIQLQCWTEVILGLFSISVHTIGGATNSAKQHLLDKIEIIKNRKEEVESMNSTELLQEGLDFNPAVNKTQVEEYQKNLEHAAETVKALEKGVTVINMPPHVDRGCGAMFTEHTGQVVPESHRADVALKFILPWESEFLSFKNATETYFGETPSEIRGFGGIPTKEVGGLDDSYEASKTWLGSVLDEIVQCKTSFSEKYGSREGWFHFSKKLDVIIDKGKLIESTLGEDVTTILVRDICEALSVGKKGQEDFIIDNSHLDRRKEANFAQNERRMSDALTNMQRAGSEYKRVTEDIISEESIRQRSILNECLEKVNATLEHLSKLMGWIELVQKTCETSSRMVGASHLAQREIMDETGQVVSLEIIKAKAEDMTKSARESKMIKRIVKEEEELIKESFNWTRAVKVLAASVGYLSRWLLGYSLKLMPSLNVLASLKIGGPMAVLSLGKFAADTFFDSIAEGYANWAWKRSMFETKADMTDEEIRTLEGEIDIRGSTTLTNAWMYQADRTLRDEVREWILRKRITSTVSDLKRWKYYTDIAYMTCSVAAILVPVTGLFTVVSIGLFGASLGAVVCCYRYWGFKIPQWAKDLVSGMSPGLKRHWPWLFVGIPVVLSFVYIYYLANGASKEIFNALTTAWENSKSILVDWKTSFLNSFTVDTTKWGAWAKSWLENNPTGTLTGSRASMSAFDYQASIHKVIYNNTEALNFVTEANIPSSAFDPIWNAFNSATNSLPSDTIVRGALLTDNPVLGEEGRSVIQGFVAPAVILGGSWIIRNKTSKVMADERVELLENHWKDVEDDELKAAIKKVRNPSVADRQQNSSGLQGTEEEGDAAILDVPGRYWASQETNMKIQNISAWVVSLCSVFYPDTQELLGQYAGEILWSQLDKGLSGNSVWAGVVAISVASTLVPLVCRQLLSSDLSHDRYINWSEEKLLNHMKIVAFKTAVNTNQKEAILKEKLEWSKLTETGKKLEERKILAASSKITADLKTQQYKLKFLEQKLRQNEEKMKHAEKEQDRMRKREKIRKLQHRKASIAAEASMRFRFINTLIRTKAPGDTGAYITGIINEQLRETMDGLERLKALNGAINERTGIVNLDSSIFEDLSSRRSLKPNPQKKERTEIKNWMILSNNATI